ncbi:MAG: phosphorylcholine transferase LicD [Acutalibacteraceae bacterium]
MTDKQQKLYELFKEINEICKRNNIEYYMAGGSLLGVIRHRGFIPWDDDMDILMTRDNWHKFVEVCKTQIPDNRVLEAPELDRGYSNMFPRYVDKSSTAIHRAQLLFDDVKGFVIDILILDPIGDSDEEYNKYLKDLMLYSDLITNVISYSYRWDFNKYRYPLYNSLSKFVGKDKILKKFENELFNYPEEKCKRYAMRWGGIPFVFPKELYGKPKLAPFLDTECMIPEETVAYLVWHYGDEWMFIPPHGEHEGHDAVYSLNKRYKPVRKEIVSLIDVKKQNRNYQKRKNRIFFSMRPFIASNNERVAVKDASAAIDLNCKFKEKDEEITELYEKNNFFALEKIFSNYYAVQLSADSIGREDFVNVYRFNNPVLVEIEKKYIEIAIVTLMNIEKISKAMRLIEVYEGAGNTLSPVLKEVKEAILTFRHSVVIFSHGQYEQSYEIARELLKKYPRCISFIKLNIRLLCKLHNLSDIKNEVKKLVDLGLKLDKDSGDFMKHKADLLFLTDKTAAYELYLEAYRNTTNGIVHLEIGDIFRENFDDVSKYILNLIDTDYEKALVELDSLKALLENDIQVLRFDAKCQYLLYKNESITFFSAEKRIRKLLFKNDNDSIIDEEYKNLLTDFIGSDSLADIYETIRKTKEYEEVQQLFKDVTQELPMCTDEERKSWLYAFCGMLSNKLGNGRRAFDYYMNSLEFCRNESLFKILRRYFVSDLKRTLKKFNSTKRGIKKFKTEDDSVVTLDYIKEQTSKYPSISYAVEIFYKLGIFDEEAKNYIDTFGVFNIDGSDGESWTKYSVNVFSKLYIIMHAANIEKELLSEEEELDDDTDLSDKDDFEEEISNDDENDFIDGSIFIEDIDDNNSYENTDNIGNIFDSEEENDYNSED